MIHHLLMSGLTMIQQCSCNEESVHLSLPNRPPSLQYSYICSYSKKMIFHCHSKGCSSTNEDKRLDCSPTFSDLSVNCETRQTWVLFIKNGYEYLNSIYCRITMQVSESIIWRAGIGEIIERKKMAGSFVRFHYHPLSVGKISTLISQFTHNWISNI